MSLYKRGSVWWMRFTTPDGHELRETTATADRRAAQELHDTRKAELWRIAKLGERPRHTWQETVVRWLEEHADNHSIGECRMIFRQADRLLGKLYLDQISRDVLAALIKQWREANLKNVTVNYRISQILVVLNAARKWEWLDIVPMRNRLPETQRRIRWLTHEEADRLLIELPDHLKPLVRFTLATGLRKHNVTHLEWNQVDVDRRVAWIHGDQAKAGKSIHVPLNAEAICVLREQQGQHPQWVFPYRGQPLGKPNHALKTALQRAKIDPGFRWHDLRHTWASWHVQAGTPLPMLKELGGWATLDMVMRYAHLSATHLAEYADRISGPRLVRTNYGTVVEKVVATG